MKWRAWQHKETKDCSHTSQSSESYCCTCRTEPGPAQPDNLWQATQSLSALRSPVQDEDQALCNHTSFAWQLRHDVAKGAFDTYTQSPEQPKNPLMNLATTTEESASPRHVFGIVAPVLGEPGYHLMLTPDWKEPP